MRGAGTIHVQGRAKCVCLLVQSRIHFPTQAQPPHLSPIELFSTIIEAKRILSPSTSQYAGGKRTKKAERVKEPHWAGRERHYGQLQGSCRAGLLRAPTDAESR